MTRNGIITNITNGLGALVWYDLTGTRISPDRMRALLASEGLDPATVLDIEPESAVRRAVRVYSEGRGEFRATIGSDTDSAIVVNILRKQKTGARKVEYLLHDSAEWSKTSQGWDALGASDEFARFLTLSDDYAANLDHEWIRPNLINASLKAMQSFSLRRQGGVYFVATAHREALDRLARIVSQIGSSSLSIAHVEATADSQASIGGAARESIGSTLSDLTDRLDEWTESARKTPEGALSNALADLADLRSRADLYSDALSVALDDLSEKIDEATDTARSMVEAGGVVSSPTTVAALIALIAEHGGEDGETLRIPGAAVLAAGVQMGLMFWRNRVGAVSAHSLGFESRVSTKGGTLTLLLAPLSASPEPEPETVEEPEPETVEVTVETVEEPEPVEIDAEERAADLRETLSQKTKAALHSIYAEVVGDGAEAPRSWRKPKIVAEIVAALG